MDPRPTYVVQRLWDPARPSYTSRSSLPIILEKLGPKQLPRLHPPTLTIIPTIPSYPSVESSSQTQPKEARLYGELQVPT